MSDVKKHVEITTVVGLGIHILPSKRCSKTMPIVNSILFRGRYVIANFLTDSQKVCRLLTLCTLDVTGGSRPPIPGRPTPQAS